ncbi:hypothetical protein PIIN_10447 [Serendipita indica DSM 11827]|uniref:Uncharacterized protein n=1 Tax=Serendipita indica (strain DSM 11827) TaxID=1109443 RepID=G4TYR1_SERID|nr:hypothetical protein PIIN_10447 [Serendipita indica DSM 11827]
MDASELRHGHHIVLTHVLDLQIVDLMCRDNSVEAVLRRLAGYLAPRSVWKPRDLQACPEAEWTRQGAHRSRPALPRKPKFDHSKWMHHPIDEENLVYAAEDVCKIQVLYELLVRNPLVNVELESSRAMNTSIFMRLHA